MPRPARSRRLYGGAYVFAPTRALVEIVAGSPVERRIRSVRRLRELPFQAPAALAALPGFTADGATRLAAALELGRRCYVSERSIDGARRARFRTPDEAAGFFHGLFLGLEVEEFHVLALDCQHRLKRHERIARGSLDHVEVHPRDVFVPAVRVRAAAIIVGHNHPSGDPAPSPHDLHLTQHLVRAGDLLGMPLLDHIVIGAGERYASLSNLGLVRSSNRSAYRLP